MYTYTVHLINFGYDRGTYDTLSAAIFHAKETGFECSIRVNEVGKDSLHLCNVSPIGGMDA